MRTRRYMVMGLAEDGWKRKDYRADSAETAINKFMKAYPAATDVKAQVVTRSQL